MSDELKLPVLIAGERIEDTGEWHRVRYEGGLEVALPVTDRRALAKAVATDRAPLREMKVSDILAFFDAVSKAWLNPSNRWRRLALEQGPRVTGYNQDNVETDIVRVGGSMIHHHLYDLVETDLGDPAVLDGWSSYKCIHSRAWPKGLAAHIMVGNVPLAGFFTLVRSLVTKNITIAKTSKRDVVIPQCLAQCMYDVDPTNPVVRALTTTYWESESETEDFVLEAADVVTVWGRASSIESVKRRLRYGTDLIEFGPKRSLAVILDGVEDWDRAALWLGFDVINYNQEACFSTQEVYVVGDPAPLVQALRHWMEQYARNAAPSVTTPDAEAHVQRCRMEAMAQGWQVHAPAGTDWTIVVTDGPTQLSEHPLSRTLYIHPCRDVSEVVATIDENVQTVAVEPFERAWEVADALTGNGADRVVALGRAGRSFPEGFIHDGFHPMRRMVRWAGLEPRAWRSYRYPYRWRNLQEEEANYRQWATGQLTRSARSDRRQ